MTGMAVICFVTLSLCSDFPFQMVTFKPSAACEHPFSASLRWAEPPPLHSAWGREGQAYFDVVILWKKIFCENCVAQKYQLRSVYRNPTWVKVPHSLINNLHKSCLWLLSIAHNHFKPQLSHQCLPQLSWFGQNSSRQWNSGGNRAFARLSGNWWGGKEDGFLTEG